MPIQNFKIGCGSALVTKCRDANRLLQVRHGVLRAQPDLMELFITDQRVGDISESTLDGLPVHDQSLLFLGFGQSQIPAKSPTRKNRLAHLGNLPLQFRYLGVCSVQDLLGLKGGYSAIKTNVGQFDRIDLCLDRLASDLQLKIKLQEGEVGACKVADKSQVTVCRASSVAKSCARSASIARRRRPNKSNWKAASPAKIKKLYLDWKTFFLPPLKLALPDSWGKQA